MIVKKQHQTIAIDSNNNNNNNNTVLLNPHNRSTYSKGSLNFWHQETCPLRISFFSYINYCQDILLRAFLPGN